MNNVLSKRSAFPVYHRHLGTGRYRWTGESMITWIKSSSATNSNKKTLSGSFLWHQKKSLYLSVNVFSTKVLIGDTIFTSPTGDETAILRGHLSHAKVSPLAVQRKYLHFSVILRPWVLVRPRESNRDPRLCSQTPYDWANTDSNYTSSLSLWMKTNEIS